MNGTTNRRQAWENWERATAQAQRAFQFANEARGTQFEQRAQGQARTATEAQEQAWGEWTQTRAQ